MAGLTACWSLAFCLFNTAGQAGTSVLVGVGFDKVKESQESGHEVTEDRVSGVGAVVVTVAGAATAGAAGVLIAKAKTPKIKNKNEGNDNPGKEDSEMVGQPDPNNRKFKREEVERDLVNKLGKDIKSHPLRQEYEAKVAQLSVYSERIRPDMSEAELRQLAIEANEARRRLGVEYKNLTPEPLRDFIYEVNIERYGDPLGPTVDYLIKTNKSYEEIIKGASKANGNIDGLLKNFGGWLKNKPDSYFYNYVGGI